MKEREYDITIGPDGNVGLVIKGYKGKRCLDAVKLFQEMIGHIQAQRETSEFYEPEEEVQYRIEQKN